ncbi:NUDIX domain-containing protein [Actinokineospora sp. NPDC004072]
MNTPPRPAEALPTPEHVASLARKRMAAGVLLRDRDDRVLLVEPSYKPNWELPGGAVEADESPWAAASRELIEELGLTRPLGRLLVVDYVLPHDGKPEGVTFIFDGGHLDEADLTTLPLPNNEILSASFHTLEQARTKTKPLLANRLTAATEAAHQGITALCEHGVRVAFSPPPP